MSPHNDQRKSTDPRLSRRAFNSLAIGTGLSAGFLPVSGLMAAPDRKASLNEKGPAELVTPKAQVAIERALAFLLRSQVKSGRNRGAFGNSGMSAGVATASLGGLAMMCGGHSPGMGKYGKAVDLAVDFVLSQVRDTGYIARKDNTAHENMYGHGFSMLFLSQAYGMTQRADIGDKLRKAVKLTCQSQNRQGGWRYQPRPTDADHRLPFAKLWDCAVHAMQESMFPMMSAKSASTM